MKKLEIESYDVLELTSSEKNETIGGSLGSWLKDLGKKVFKVEWTGFMDGDASNDDVNLYIMGFKIF